MSVIYEQADTSIHELAQDILTRHHKHMEFTKGDWVRLCILMATSPEGEPAIKVDGYPCAGVCSIIPYKQRVDKRADVEIILDAKWWADATDNQRRALLDHEITHIEIKTDKNGCVETDDLGRPKLRMRLHDFQLGGFRSIARRYGAAALEVAAAVAFRDDFGRDVYRDERPEVGAPAALEAAGMFAREFT